MNIQRTSDYKKFNTILGNRRVKKAHVNKLKSAFEWNPEAASWVPIIVNENYEVIDGQHRLEALKQLELPVYYRVIEGLTIEDVQALNSNTKPWTPNDYAEAYAHIGNRNYRNYLDFKIEFGYNHDITMKYVALSYPVTGESFKNGLLKTQDMELSRKYGAMLAEIGKFIPHYKLRATALAFLRMAQNSKYDHKRMLEKVAALGHTVERFTQLEDAVDALSKVYNHGLEKNREIKF